MKKRIKKKYFYVMLQLGYGSYIDALTGIKSTKISSRVIRKWIHIQRDKPVFTLHRDDLIGDELFSGHEPGGRYHSEDCNQNNPNHPTYRKRKHFKLSHKDKVSHCYVDR